MLYATYVSIASTRGFSQVLPQLKRIGIGDADAGVIERLESLVSQKRVFSARSLVHGVHSKLWQAHVNGMHAGLNVGEVA